VTRLRRHRAERPPLRAESPDSRKRLLMVPRGRSETLTTIGMETGWWHDLYHAMNTITWGKFLLIAVAIYLSANVIFAGLYLLQPGAIGQAKPGDFGDAFFFSVQTMATIGYGKLTPDTVYANLLVTVQTVFAMLLLALTTGMMFARFSRPTARVLFSNKAIIGRYNGTPVLSFRMANERKNQILQAEVSVSVLRTEALLEGGTMRRFYEMKLLRSRTPIFALTFQVMHPIDEESPLFGMTAEDLAAEEAEFVILVTGIDATVSQTIHARFSYSHEDLVWDHRFADIFGYTEQGEMALDFRKFHESVPLSGAPPSEAPQQAADRAAAIGAGTD
jgi:inward rectifier potassium channel